jgi:hypothetical protein
MCGGAFTICCPGGSRSFSALSLGSPPKRPELRSMTSWQRSMMGSPVFDEDQTV